MIKFLVMDVDGTLTDGKIYMGVDGECFKAFDIKDGYALHTLLKENGIIPVIITARKSPMVEHRCKELGVTEIYQGVMKKLDCLEGVIEKYSSADQKYDLSNVAYIGDDLLDLQCMNPIKEAGGVVGCPSNASKEVIAICDYISRHKGGEGAVRDLTEYIIYANNYTLQDNEILKFRIDTAVAIISKLDFTKLKVGRYDVNDYFYYTVQDYNSFLDGEARYESHRKYIDIQWIVRGEERLFVTNRRNLKACTEYDANKDVIYYNKTNQQSSLILKAGSCAILFPDDAHMPGSVFGRTRILKIVGKVSAL